MVKGIEIMEGCILFRIYKFVSIGHFHLLVINIMVAGHKVFIGALAEAIDTLVNAIDVNDNRFVGLPVDLVNVCSEELLYSFILHASSQTVRAAVLSMNDFTLVTSGLSRQKFPLKFFLPKRFFA